MPLTGWKRENEWWWSSRWKTIRIMSLHSSRLPSEKRYWQKTQQKDAVKLKSDLSIEFAGERYESNDRRSWSDVFRISNRFCERSTRKRKNLKDEKSSFLSLNHWMNNCSSLDRLVRWLETSIIHTQSLSTSIRTFFHIIRFSSFRMSASLSNWYYSTIRSKLRMRHVSISLLILQIGSTFL